MSARFLFFAGKGGVGKTTCAAARAVVEAGASSPGNNVLVVSTDPAHSLGDALGTPLTARPRHVGRGGRLRAVELDAPRAFARWLAANRQALADAIERGTWLDREDVNSLLDLSVPGVDELVGLIEIARLARAGDYTLVVVDTAPTGHTLQLFAAPGTVATLAGVLDRLQREHRWIRQQFSADAGDAADRLVALLAEQAREAAALLSDARTSELYWVLMPEELSVAETEDGLAAVDRQRIRVAEVIVNRVTPDGPSCPICDRRRHDERVVIAGLPGRLPGGRPLRIVQAETREPRGIAALARIGRQLKATRARRARTVRGGGAGRATANGRTSNMALSLSEGIQVSPPDSLESMRAAHLIFFGGKGGVGKTTCAAAAAVRLARANSGDRLLLLSTDPAHSLSDVLGMAIGDRVRSIAGAASRLDAREMDARAVLAARRATLEAALDEIASTLGAGAFGMAASAGLSELMDVPPPGVDEMLAVLSVVEARRDYDTIIVDTAPTGHTLRLLAMPDIAREWTQALMRLLLKYRSLVRPGRLAAELIDLSKSIRGLHDMLRRPAETRFVVVTRAAELPRRETERLLGSLRELGLAVPALVVNAMTLGPGRCPRCRAAARAEGAQIRALRRARKRRMRDCAIILTPLAAPAPRGVAALDRWARSWSS